MTLQEQAAAIDASWEQRKVSVNVEFDERMAATQQADIAVSVDWDRRREEIDADFDRRIAEIEASSEEQDETDQEKDQVDLKRGLGSGISQTLSGGGGGGEGGSDTIAQKGEENALGIICLAAAGIVAVIAGQEGKQAYYQLIRMMQA